MKLSAEECKGAIVTNPNYAQLPDKIDYNSAGKTHGAPSMLGRGVVAVRPSAHALDGASAKREHSLGKNAGDIREFPQE